MAARFLVHSYSSECIFHIQLEGNTLNKICLIYMRLRCNATYWCILSYAQALHIDWAVFQNCPINVKIFQYFFGHFENCPINVQNYPINVKCLRTPPVQAFHIDWVIFQKMPKIAKNLKTTQSMWNACTGGGAQAFHIDWVVPYIDWAVLKMDEKSLIYFHIDWAVLKYCPINV